MRQKKIPGRFIPGSANAWSASGPGWANQGITFRVRQNSGERQHTVYYPDFKILDSRLFKIALVATEALEAEVRTHCTGQEAEPGHAKTTASGGTGTCHWWKFFE